MSVLRIPVIATVLPMNGVLEASASLCAVMMNSVGKVIFATKGFVWLVAEVTPSVVKAWLVLGVNAKAKQFDYKFEKFNYIYTFLWYDIDPCKSILCGQCASCQVVNHGK